MMETICQGIKFDTKKLLYLVTIEYNDRLVYLGYYSSLAQAKAARKEGEDKYWIKK